AEAPDLALDPLSLARHRLTKTGRLLVRSLDDLVPVSLAGIAKLLAHPLGGKEHVTKVALEPADVFQLRLERPEAGPQLVALPHRSLPALEERGHVAIDSPLVVAAALRIEPDLPGFVERHRP